MVKKKKTKGRSKVALQEVLQAQVFQAKEIAIQLEWMVRLMEAEEVLVRVMRDNVTIDVGEKAIERLMHWHFGRDYEECCSAEHAATMRTWALRAVNVLLGKEVK